MTFDRPELLPWGPVLLVLIALAIGWQWWRSRRLVTAYGGPEAARRLTGRALDRFPLARLTCVVVATATLLLAGAGARPEAAEPPPPPTPVDLIIAVDLSHSMAATDVAPSRAERAREVVAQVLDAGVADRVALTLFAGWPYRLVPVTDDRAVVDFFVPTMSPELVEQRQQGTSLAEVIGFAAETWAARSRPDAIPVLLIVSDGEAHGTNAAVLDSVAVVARAGLRVWTAGVGTTGGGPLFVAGSTSAPLLDATGAQVVASYDPDLLREIAGAGGGAFHHIDDEAAVGALLNELRELGGDVATTDPAPADPTMWLLLVALALLITDAILDTGIMTRGRSRRGDAAW
ncbi:MAG: VWA domain-containing protein [Gemmatimonadota bacterium]|nr:VWA domain-containing protein [Gemmatimonadota bacterium]